MLAQPVFALDYDAIATDVFARNFPTAEVRCGDIRTFLGARPGRRLSRAERELRTIIGSLDVVVGGPPCQGHSDLNNHTRRTDRKNRLFRYMARFAEVIGPKHVVIENVNGVRFDHDRVLDWTLGRLSRLGYAVDVATLDSKRFGIPQDRKRVFVVATLGQFDGLAAVQNRQNSALTTFHWACDDLLDREGLSAFDEAAIAAPHTRGRIDYLFENDIYELPDDERPDCHRLKRHTYKSVYGRLRLDRPAPTITTGFQVMGQGRFVHPTRRRTLTPHEAARLQFLPDWFTFGQPRRRTEYGRLVGNAVPSKLVAEIVIDLLR
jgi:DNA (cytosine-5)-methyltransferase 1